MVASAILSASRQGFLVKIAAGNPSRPTTGVLGISVAPYGKGRQAIAVELECQMIRVAAEYLSAIRQLLANVEAKKTVPHNAWSTIKYNFSILRPSIVEDYEISQATSEFLIAAADYTGGDNLTYHAMLTGEERTALFDSANARLLSLRDALRKARLSEWARTLGIGDETEVPDPF
jgi:hypothetical protein